MTILFVDDKIFVDFGMTKNKTVFADDIRIGVNMVNSEKINTYFNKLFDNQIKKYLDLAKNVNNVPKESIIFLESANNSIKNSIDLINNDEYIDSLCLLRSSFEAIMFSLAIFFDSKIYDVYKHYNSNFYRKALMEKYKKQQKRDPKFKIPDIDKNKKDLLKPEIMRNIVAMHYKEIYAELFNECNDTEEVKSELGEFYKYLCNFSHPSIVKTYTFKIQNDSNNLDSIRAVYKLNINYCKLLLLLALNFLTSKDNMNNVYDLYIVLFCADCCMIKDTSNFKKLLKKYDEYLYLNVTRKYFAKNSEKIKQIEQSIKEICGQNDLNNKLNEIIKSVITNFDSKELWKQYLKF